MNENKQKLIIVGIGPQAQIARDYFMEYSNYDVAGFACHSEFIESDNIYGMPLIAIEDLLENILLMIRQLLSPLATKDEQDEAVSL